MKFKNQKGISLIALSVAITILVIITGTLVYSSNIGNRVKALNDLYSDIEVLNNKISEYYIKYGDIPKSEIYTNLSFLNKAENNQINPGNGNDFYIINLSSLDGIILNYGRDYENVGIDNLIEDVYIINEQSHTIYYPRGVEVQGIVYYTSPGEWTSVE